MALFMYQTCNKMFLNRVPEKNQNTVVTKKYCRDVVIRGLQAKMILTTIQNICEKNPPPLPLTEIIKKRQI